MAALDGVLILDAIAASTAAQGATCMGALEADLCVTRVLPIADRIALVTDFIVPFQFKSDFLVDRLLSIEWRAGSMVFLNRTIPIMWSGVLVGGRTLPIAWVIPFIDVDRICPIQTNLELLVDRKLASAWTGEDLWVKQVAGETDAWIDQVAGETDAWTKQVAGEIDAWS